MDKERVLFVFNPHSGRGLIRDNLPAILDSYSAKNCVLMVHATQARMDAASIVEEYLAADMCDRIICAGGDGTLDEVAGAVMRSGRDIPIGIISSGSTNDFGYSLGIPQDVMAAANTAMTGVAFPCDIATLDGRYFTYTASFGLFSDVSYETSQRVKNALGHAAYVLNGITKLSQIKKYHVAIESDAGNMEGDYILGMVVSSFSVGGFRGITGENVSLDDGLYEMILIRAPKNFAELGKIIGEAMAHDFTGNFISRTEVSRVRFRFSEEVAWSLDGEYGGTGTDAEIEVFRRAIKYLR